MKTRLISMIFLAGALAFGSTSCSKDEVTETIKNTTDEVKKKLEQKDFEPQKLEEKTLIGKWVLKSIGEVGKIPVTDLSGKAEEYEFNDGGKGKYTAGSTVALDINWKINEEKLEYSYNDGGTSLTKKVFLCAIQDGMLLMKKEGDKTIYTYKHP